VIRLLVADDDALVRSGLSTLLRAAPASSIPTSC
jgi:DNA-binding NarL/FixJ family response regulator